MEEKISAPENQKKRKRINVGSDSEEEVTENVEQVVEKEIKDESKAGVKTLSYLGLNIYFLW